MQDFRDKKLRGERVTALTAYDYPTGRLLDESGIDIILVGDSVGMVVLGYEDTTQVTLAEMVHHTRAVARGVKRALLVTDPGVAAIGHPERIRASIEAEGIEVIVYDRAREAVHLIGQPRCWRHVCRL